MRDALLLCAPKVLKHHPWACIRQISMVRLDQESCQDTRQERAGALAPSARVHAPTHCSIPCTSLPLLVLVNLQLWFL